MELSIARAVPEHAPAQQADFELTKREQGGWQLRVISASGLYWIQSDHEGWQGKEHLLSLADANTFLKAARKNGLKTECIGPNSRSLL
jgi:hypothetical protein